MSGDFVHLHVHTEYSLLDGLGRVKNMVAEAKRLGQHALAITDHGAMHGAIEFSRAARDAGIKPLLGVEAYQTQWGRPMGGRDSQLDKENYHLLLLAKNLTGYRNLLKIASHAQLDGYYYKPRIDHNFLAAHAEGLIATTGCMGAEVPQLLDQGKEREAYERLGWYVETFGRENFFIELQEHSIPDLVKINKQLVPWAAKFNLQYVVTNDVHYVREEDGSPHEVLLCVQTGTTVTDPKRMKMSDRSYFLKSRAQMEDTFRPFIDLPPEAFENTLRIAEMCDVDPEDKQYHLPDIAIPEGFTYESYLRHLTEEGLTRLYGARATDAEVQARKEHELRVIHQMGFDVYYLIVADLCDFALRSNIWWNVRGSGAGSLVAYCTGITGVDPLKNNLIFERFLNPGRVTMPDFDLDFPDDQREQMIRYTVAKFGESQVAQIVTFGRMKARAAVRDVGRAQGVELARVDKLAKLIPGIPGKPVTIKQCLTDGEENYVAELAQFYKSEPWARDLLDTSMQLEGVARHSGIHAAAVIVADRELSHYTPLMRPSKGGVTTSIAQYEFPILESIGLLKVDFLGLSTLSVMREAARLIKERHNITFTLGNIPYEGEEAAEAFKLLSSGEVSGVFQVESQGMRRVLTEMRPTMFEHIVATISLYRPGPMDYIPQYIQRLHGKEKTEYKHPSLEAILAETYGIIVYQEQIIQILSALAGYTPGDADLVRRAISKKKESEITKHGVSFVKGCEDRGIPKATADAIYADIAFFARYGFNKSHAADYAVITVQTALLKALYPVEYMAALLLIERDKTEKVVTFVSECRRMGIDVLPPDVNYSSLDFDIQIRPPDTQQIAQRDPSLAYAFPVPAGSAIRFGMAAIKNVGEQPVQAILAARTADGPFRSLEDFCDRVNLQHVGKRPLECLIKAGALDRFGKRSQLLAVLDQAFAQSKSVHDARESGQLSIFDLMGGGEEQHVTPIRLPEMEEVSGKEKLTWERELLGVYSISHPLQNLGAELARYTTCSCAELDERYDGRGVTLAGLITSVRTLTTKKGDLMAYVMLEDLQGSSEVVVFPKAFVEHRDKLVLDAVVMIKGTAQTRNGQTNLLADVVQTHFDRIVSAEQPNHLQPPLLRSLPTINGVAVAGAGDNDNEDDAEADAETGTDDAMAEEIGLGAMPMWNGGGDFAYDNGEANPFLNDAPAFLNGTAAAAPQRATVQVAEMSPARPPATAAAPVVVYAAAAPVAVMESAPTALHLREGGGGDEIGASTSNGSGNGVSNGAARAEGPGAPESRAPAQPESAPSVIPPASVTQPHMAEAKAPPATRADGAPTPAPMPGKRPGERLLVITFRRTADVDRDKFRLKEIYEMVRDPRGRDRFAIALVDNGQTARLAFPNDLCSITERLITDLEKHFKLKVHVETGAE